MQQADAITIKLSKGKVALIDFENFERVSQHKWSAGELYPGLWYGMRWTPDGMVYLHRFIM